ncbi:MAG TPA: IS630 family transposase [Thermoplasmata archaeon]|nr:IS630 family transposase [Thermoplasmata archaeon]
MVIRVRELTNEEGNKLRRIVRHGQDAIEVKRAQVILASAQGASPPKIALIALMSEVYIRELIHAFNEHGFAMLKPKWGPGRPPKFTDEQRRALVDLATSRPRELDLPYAEWSLSRLREQAIARGIVPSISEEWLRVILHESEVSHQSIRTWKESEDPEFAKKKRRIEWLVGQPHNPPIVLSADEIGPIQLIPQRGEGWFPEGKPETIPAEYAKECGTTYYFLGLNVYHQRLSGRVYRTKHSVNWLEFLQELRAPYPKDQWVWLIQDGSSTHWTPAVRQSACENRTVLVSSPTKASWLNPVECHAGDIQRLALPGTQFTTVEEVGVALDRAVAYRNEERARRGKRFRGTVRKDHRRKPKVPLCKRSIRT